MQSRYIKLGSIALLVGVLSFVFFSFQNNSEDLRRELLLKVITFAVSNGHYNPGKIDDDFSEKAFKLYIERIDYGKRFLLQPDVDNLAKYKKDLDDAMKNIDFAFLDLSVSILNERIKESETYCNELLAAPFDYNTSEAVEMDAEKLTFSRDEKEMHDRWRKILKYEVMASILDMEKDQKKALEKSDTVTIKSFTELEVKARTKIQKRYSEFFHRVNKLNANDRLDTYVNSLVNVFDPHTEYFPPKEKTNFDIRFSGQLEGIGAQLTQKDAYIEVANIIPGSPSWKDGELEPGDVILKVAQADEEFVDVVDMRLDEAVLLIRGKKGTRVRLNIKKIDGTIKEISLVRDVVVLEETYARSAIIKDEPSGKNFGYLKLPSFYVDFSDPKGRNCYTDVKAEIEKLKAENVSGIIFDLRDDGGGSLEDVVKIAGLFIPDGPIVQSIGTKSSTKIHKDLDPQIQYDGSLVVMVNAISASASEIFAAALQDYNRAIIIGGNSTYGKGTVQNFTELDRMVPKKPADMEELGSLKMTVQKFYRINGGATQIKGVTPDIIMPDYYNYMELNESYMDYPMPWDEISSLTYNEWELPYDKDYIVTLSNKRIVNDTLFNLIEENGKRLKELRDNTSISLNYSEFSAEYELREKEGKKYERIGKDPLKLAVDILNSDQQSIQSDTSKQARWDAWIAGLTKDVYLLEATNILRDIDAYQIKNARKEQ